MSSFTTNVPVTLGLMTWGREGVEMARVHDLATCEEMLDILQKHGHNEVDTALVYGDGSSEEYLGQTRWKERGIVVDTKLFPGQYAGRDVKFTLESIRKQIEVQLAAVKTQQFDLWYLRKENSGPQRVAIDESHTQTLPMLRPRSRSRRKRSTRFTRRASSSASASPTTAPHRPSSSSRLLRRTGGVGRIRTSSSSSQPMTDTLLRSQADCIPG